MDEIFKEIQNLKKIRNDMHKMKCNVDELDACITRLGNAYYDHREEVGDMIEQIDILKKSFDENRRVRKLMIEKLK